VVEEAQGGEREGWDGKGEIWQREKEEGGMRWEEEAERRKREG
jgi:hypothetical protein